jgi:hypothetical protein
MGRLNIATPAQESRHTHFVTLLHIRAPYAPAVRYSDGGAGRRRHRSSRIGGKGK